MTVYKDTSDGTWHAIASYSDWKGVPSRKHKYGFATKREATQWKTDFLYRYADDLSMTFEKFYEVYTGDKKPRLKLHTWIQKDYMVNDKIMPYFREMPMNEITAKVIVRWQNDLMNRVGKNGKPYAMTYLKTIHNQLTAILTHACRFYGLKDNPATKAGSMGEKNAEEMSFWTRDEYRLFSKEAMREPRVYYAYQVLYWTGMRVGELLALTPSDFNFFKKTVSITKSYQRLQGADHITCPKTKKSRRIIAIPDALCIELEQYLALMHGIGPEDRMFPVAKSLLGRKLKAIAAKAGVKTIRVHDLRHSHVSHLIELGYSALAIGDRIGHKSIEITMRYAHLFPHKQEEMAAKLNGEMEAFSYGEKEGNREKPNTLPNGRFQVFRCGTGRAEQAG